MCDVVGPYRETVRWSENSVAFNLKKGPFCSSSGGRDYPAALARSWKNVRLVQVWDFETSWTASMFSRLRIFLDVKS